MRVCTYYNRVNVPNSSSCTICIAFHEYDIQMKWKRRHFQMMCLMSFVTEFEWFTFNLSHLRESHHSLFFLLVLFRFIQRLSLSPSAICAIRFLPTRS